MSFESTLFAAIFFVLRKVQGSGGLSRQWVKPFTPIKGISLTFAKIPVINTSSIGIYGRCCDVIKSLDGILPERTYAVPLMYAGNDTNGLHWFCAFYFKHCPLSLAPFTHQHALHCRTIFCYSVNGFRYRVYVFG